MADNKNQHYVPRCHLRPFTLNASGAAISLFNVKHKKLIPNAPVKNQCSRDYFYGTDEKLESAIQLIESGYARALQKLMQDSRSLTEECKTILRTFWLFQHLRTEAAARSSVQMAESTRTLAGLLPEEYPLGIKEAVQIACHVFADSMHEVDDLKFCLIKNKTNVPFVTSDNPAVLTNKWRLEHKSSAIHSFGIGTAGALALLPLTPKLLFLGYDGDIYSIPNEKGIVEVRNVRDIDSLNSHQFLQCVANVYIHDSSLESTLRTKFADIEFARPKSRHIVHYAQLDGIFEGHSRYSVVPPDERDMEKEAILHSQVIHPNPGIWPSQVRIRQNGAYYTNDTGLGYVRFSRTLVSSHTPFRRQRI